MLTVAIPKERRAFETRVAAIPETVKKLSALGVAVVVEEGAGHASDITDAAYAAAGATLVSTPEALYAKADVVFKVSRPMLGDEGELNEVALLKPGTTLIGGLSYHGWEAHQKAYVQKELTVASLELLPRISRAQSMDILSSQSNLAGYRSVLEAAMLSPKVFPMMMTAAGTITPAKVLVVGVGVAGLQAIATAKRLGAVVSAFDVRSATKEQVMSLGAKFIEVDRMEHTLETHTGYATEMDASYQRRQAMLMLEVLQEMDIVITTALIPGKPAPRLITEEMLSGVKPGTVIVDLASDMGGNVAFSKEQEVVRHNGITIFGCSHLAAYLPRDASPLYSRNLYNFFALLFNPETKTLNFNLDDEIIAKTIPLIHGKLSSKEV